jgi:hypothetical protein
MASHERVRAYLAYWFQLGKPVVWGRDQAPCLPSPIFTHGQYSQSFEQCWQQIESRGGEACYLAGTDQSVADLLSEKWDIEDCARCALPIPLSIGVAAATDCPCHDLPQWPNAEMPQPRAAVDSQYRLTGIRDRLQATSTAEQQQLQQLFQRSANLPSPSSEPDSAMGISHGVSPGKREAHNSPRGHGDNQQRHPDGKA